MSAHARDSVDDWRSPRLGELLESPRWHVERRKISFVDIPTGRLFELTPDTWEMREFSTGVTPLGSALPWGDGYLLVGADGVWAWKPHDVAASPEKWADIPSAKGILSNDATFHHGFVWVGRMSESEEPEQGSVWKVGPASSEEIISGLTLPNGMVPSPKAGHMLLAESSDQVIYEFPLDATGLKTDELAVYADLKGWTPDGLAWDHRGRLWVARWGEGKVSCHENSPSDIADVLTGTPQSTALAFDEDGFMYVTTAHEGFTAEEVSADPHAGTIFVPAAPVGGQKRVGGADTP